MDVLYGIDNPLFLENMRDLTYLMKTLLPWLLRYQVNIRKAMRLSRPVQAYLRRFTENGALIDMVAQHFFQNTPSFFALSYFGQYLDYRYPAGGTGVLAEKMTDCILDAGGEILTRAEVINADVNLHEITLSDERTFRYKKLIWAAYQKTLFSALTAPKTASIEKQQLLTENSVGGDSVLTLFLGIDLPADYFRSRCGAHAFYTATAEGLSALPKWEDRSKLGNSALLDWVGAYLSRTTYEISCPALRDEALAPEGKTGVILSTLMDCGLVRTLSETGGYEAFKAYCTEKIVKTLENSLFPGVSEHILFTICATPLTIERETSNHNGAITGWAFTNKEMPAENRFAKIAKAVFTPMEDVYQCGQWSFSPSGLPVSILTGKLAADAVHKTCGGHKR
jgi:phytoene dehydrogenase-like protein